jgi:ABC-type bacteriocin/lantibiotic exporter with double-glycine peptidase domain
MAAHHFLSNVVVALRLRKHSCWLGMKSIRQRDATDCGAACLAMVAAHHGHHTSVTGLRDLVATDKDGLTLKGLLDGAVALGFDAQALTGSAEHFTAEVPTPCIAHVIRGRGGSLCGGAQDHHHTFLPAGPGEGSREKHARGVLGRVVRTHRRLGAGGDVQTQEKKLGTPCFAFSHS